MTSLPASSSRRPAWLLGLLLASATVVVQAQPAGTGAHAGQHAHGSATGHGPHAMGHGDHSRHMAERAGQMQARQAKRLDELKAKLQLTPAQDSAWTSFTSALQTRPAHAGSHEPQHQALSQLSTPERLERMKALRAQHHAEMNAFMDRRAEATKAFYAGLTPEQQKVFDTETARMMQAHGPGQHHGGHHGHHGQGGRS